MSNEPQDFAERVYTVHVRTGSSGNNSGGTDKVAEIIWTNDIGVVTARLRIDGSLRDPHDPRRTHLDENTTYVNEYFVATGILQNCRCWVRLSRTGGGGNLWKCISVDVFEPQFGEALFTYPPEGPWVTAGAVDWKEYPRARNLFPNMLEGTQHERFRNPPST
jgi:hypothetical protein